MLAILLLILPEAAGQKPVIDLLPSDHAHYYHDALNDTGYVRDTLVPVIPVKPKAPDTTRVIRKKESRNTVLHPGTILNRMVSTRVRSTRILIFYLTALKQ